MAAPVSTVPSVKRYLAEQIQSALNELPIIPGLPAPIVVYDAPGLYRPNDIIAVGQVYQRYVKQMAMVGSGGAGWLQEDYEIEIVTDVFRAGETLQIDAYERAWLLNSLVEEVFRADPSLGGRVIVSRSDFSIDGSQWEKDHKGWMVNVVNRFKILARI